MVQAVARFFNPSKNPIERKVFSRSPAVTNDLDFLTWR
jgi:hypothetical protein